MPPLFKNFQKGNMIMNEKIKARSALARAYFLQGYGCAQSVLLAFSDLTGMDEQTSARLGSSFGGGMGRLREVCGGGGGRGSRVGTGRQKKEQGEKQGEQSFHGQTSFALVNLPIISICYKPIQENYYRPWGKSFYYALI